MSQPFSSARLRGEVKSVIARWALRRRSEAALPSEDEATHPWNGRRRFEEDYTFACVQPELGLVVRLARLPGRAVQRVWIWVLRPGDVVGLEAIAPAHEGEPWRGGGLEIDCLTPFRAWSVRYAGTLTRYAPTRDNGGRSVAAELQFTAERPPFCPGTDDDPSLLARRLSEATWDRALLRGVRRAQTRGYVQTGRMEGTLRLGDTLVPVRGACWRQHRWGVLDWGGSDAAFQCFVAHASGAVTWVHHAAFPFVTLEGGFHAPNLASMRSPPEPVHRPLVAIARSGARHLSLGYGAPMRDAIELELASRASAEFVVDGRGALAVHLVEGSDAWGIWADQRRVLARPERSGEAR